MTQDSPWLPEHLIVFRKGREDTSVWDCTVIIKCIIPIWLSEEIKEIISGKGLKKIAKSIGENGNNIPWCDCLFLTKISLRIPGSSCSVMLFY